MYHENTPVRPSLHTDFLPVLTVGVQGAFWMGYSENPRHFDYSPSEFTRVSGCEPHMECTLGWC